MKRVTYQIGWPPEEGQLEILGLEVLVASPEVVGQLGAVAVSAAGLAEAGEGWEAGVAAAEEEEAVAGGATSMPASAAAQPVGKRAFAASAAVRSCGLQTTAGLGLSIWPMMVKPQAQLGPLGALGCPGLHLDLLVPSDSLG